MREVRRSLASSTEMLPVKLLAKFPRPAGARRRRLLLGGSDPDDRGGESQGQT